jgi:2-polyprenyl-6-methoxyphenol hydroxylase-like FAD-dependent oxidoreductase
MKTAIIGGGIAGLTAAIALKRIGLETEVFEAAPEIKPLGAGLGLAANAIKAFQKIGIAAGVIAAGHGLSAFTICDEKGRTITRADSRAISQKYGLDNFAIHRGRLHEVLLRHLDPATLHTGKRVVDYTETAGGITLQFKDGSTCTAGQVIVADGIHSPLRRKLLPRSAPRYAGYTCWRAVIDFAGAEKLQEATETWGPKGRFGIVPLPEGKVYWFACLNAPANSPEMRAFRVQDLLRVFGGYHDLIPALLKKTKDEQLLWNDICDLEPVRQYAFGRLVLIGDAAHATTPNMGQGACQAIEDAVVLAEELQKAGDFTKAAQCFEARRLARTHWIVNNSLRIGQVAQLENRLLTGLRNQLFRLLPKSLNEKQLEKLYAVDF